MTKIMIAGGNMARLVAAEIILSTYIKEDNFVLTKVGLSETYHGSTPICDGGKKFIDFVPMPDHKEAILKESPDIIVDFTNAQSVNRNAELYCECGVNFIMGTTGGDRNLLMKTVEESSVSAVIAPNMAKQIVAFQAMMEFAAENFPNAFKGYELVVTESHQASKKGTSGTAEAMVEYFNRLGIPFAKDQIEKIRDRTVQRVKVGVPLEHLGGHGYHDYRLRSEDGTVSFGFIHNVNGRDVYVEGTLDAIRFLVKNAKPGKVYSMIDVLKGKTV